ncbi:hypothetical protein D3C71_2021220 [compost metagenome]
MQSPADRLPFRPVGRIEEAGFIQAVLKLKINLEADPLSCERYALHRLRMAVASIDTHGDAELAALPGFNAYGSIQILQSDHTRAVTWL